MKIDFYIVHSGEPYTYKEYFKKVSPEKRALKEYDPSDKQLEILTKLRGLNSVYQKDFDIAGLAFRYRFDENGKASNKGQYMITKNNDKYILYTGVVTKPKGIFVSPDPAVYDSLEALIKDNKDKNIDYLIKSPELTKDPRKVTESKNLSICTEREIKSITLAFDEPKREKPRAMAIDIGEIVILNLINIKNDKNTKTILNNIKYAVRLTRSIRPTAKPEDRTQKEVNFDIWVDGEIEKAENKAGVTAKRDQEKRKAEREKAAAKAAERVKKAEKAAENIRLDSYNALLDIIKEIEKDIVKKKASKQFKKTQNDEKKVTRFNLITKDVLTIKKWANENKKAKATIYDNKCFTISEYISELITLLKK